MRKRLTVFILLFACSSILVTNSFHAVADPTQLNIENLLASANGVKDAAADGPYKNAQKPSTNVFKYLKKFSGQQTQTVNGESVRRDLYYQNGTLVGVTSMTPNNFIGNFDRTDLKKTLRIIFKTHEVGLSVYDAVGWFTYTTDSALYVEKNGCIYVAVAKRLANASPDDQYSGISDVDEPNFFGAFWTCEEFNVPIETFLNSIEEASQIDNAQFHRILSTQKTSKPIIGKILQPTASTTLTEKLSKLKRFFEKGLINEEAYKAKMKEILEKL